MNTVLPCGCLSEYTQLLIAVKHLNVLCSTFENVKMLKKKCQAKFSNSVICFVHGKYLTGRKNKNLQLLTLCEAFRNEMRPLTLAGK